MEEKQLDAVVGENNTDGGKIIFADDVVATIAALATNEVEGVSGMSGGVMVDLSERLGRKNITKGVKVEVGTEEVAIDISVNICYGYRIREVCCNIQQSVRDALETMTGLRVVEVNVFVQSVTFEPTESPRAAKKREKEAQKEAELAEQAAAEATEE